MNPLDRYPNIRAFLYMVQWLVNGALTIAGVVFTANQTAIDALPQWYVLALAIAPVLWTYLGVTAQANTPTDDRDQRGQVNFNGGLFITVLFAIFLILAIFWLLGVPIHVG